MPVNQAERIARRKARQEAIRKAQQGSAPRLYGKAKAVHDARTFQLQNYLNLQKLPTPPTSCDWTTQVTTWPMMKNNTIGDCTVACAGHLIELWTKDESGTAIILSDNQIVAAYSAISGYKPGKPNTDNGATILSVLKYWKKTGIGGHKIQAYASLELKNATFDGLGRVQLASDLYASTREGKKEAAIQWLRDCGYENMVTETYNASSLKALFRRQIAEGVEIPDDLFNVSPFIRASIVKA